MRRGVQVCGVCTAQSTYGFLWEKARALDVLRTELPASLSSSYSEGMAGLLASEQLCTGSVGCQGCTMSTPDLSPSWGGMPSPGGMRPQPPRLPGWKRRAGLGKPSFAEICWLPLGQLLPVSEACPCLSGSGWESRCQVSGTWLWRLARVAVKHTGLATSKIWVRIPAPPLKR